MIMCEKAVGKKVLFCFFNTICPGEALLFISGMFSILLPSMEVTFNEFVHSYIIP